MPIIKVGNIYEKAFRGKDEPMFDVVLGGLTLHFSTTRPYRNIGADDRYKLSLILNPDQFKEVETEVMAQLKELNKVGQFGLKDNQLKELFARAIGPSTVNAGMYRFYGSRPMGYMDKETETMKAFNLPMYELKDDGSSELIEGGVSLGPGSVVRSKFEFSLFKKDKQVLLNIKPVSVTILKRVEPPKRETLGHDGVDDAPSAYDF